MEGKVGGKTLRGTPTALCARKLLNDKTTDLWETAFRICWIGSVVSDERIGHGHELAAVGGIGEHLLITAHGGIETDLTDRTEWRTDGEPVK